ncbi:MAG: hypothetical protein JWO05_2996 [Gemmatimonadetes bacterium]|nr:hypothetical protein [Gemmatimonadota bacterium]
MITLAPRSSASLVLALAVLAACGSASTDSTTTRPKVTSVTGTMSFVLAGSATGAAAQVVPRATQSLAANDEYIVSPSKAKITFTSVDFRGKSGETLASSAFSGCAVTYDRALSTGATLLDCPFTVPVGDIYQVAVYFDKAMQLLVSDPVAGIYTSPGSATGFVTSAPAGGANYVPYTVLIGTGTSRATPIVFTAPITVTETSSPKLYITTDMLHTVQLKVDAGGTTLSPNVTSDPVALFGGPTKGTSSYYSNANTTASYKVGSVNDYRSLRIYYDQAGAPLFVMSPSTCGIEGGKAAWASPVVNDVGGWLGRDASGVLAWALPTGAVFSTYSAFYTMQEQTVIGQSTVLRCKATATPPAPADGKTYASGAPAMPAPDKTTTLVLVAR